MKPRSTLRSFLSIASSALLTISYAHAATLYWDANGLTAAQTDGAGAWTTADLWWTGSANTTWSGTNSAVFGYSGAGGAVTLAGTITIDSLVFNPFTGTYTIGTAGAGNTITLNNGITKNSGGIVTIASPLSLGGAQTWTNNGTGALNINDAVTLNGNLTIDGIGNVVMNNAAAIIGGTGDLIKNGTGNISHGGNTPAHNFTGNLIINGGSISSQSQSWLTGRNTSLTNGYIGGRFNSGFTWTDGLGTGANQIQITGISGFSGEGNSGSTFQIGGALSTLKWGASTENGATGFFNPTALLLNGNANMNSNGQGSLNNAIDLNGTSREFTSLHTNWNGANNTGFTINGAITNTAGTAAGLIRTGVGNLSLLAANTYDGATTINGGTLTLRSSGTIANTSALNLGGGTLRLVNTANTQRFADVAVSATAGGGITYENTAGANVYTESLGALTLTKGQVNVLLSNDHNAAVGSQTLTFGTAGTGNLTQGVSGKGTITFSAPTTGLNATKNSVAVFGAGTTAAGEIVGPWATTGLSTSAQRDYAVYNSDYVTAANITASGEGTWTTLADNYTMDSSAGVITLAATRNMNSLRNTVASAQTISSVNTGAPEAITITGHGFTDGTEVVFGPGAPGGLAAGTKYYVKGATANTFQLSALLDLSTTVNLTNAGTANNEVALFSTTNSQLTLALGADLGTYGILNGSTFAMTIAPGTGGSVTLPTTSAGSLYVTTGSGAITINAPITDNTGALTLVKSGSAGNLILNGVNTFTGAIDINAGTLQIGTNAVANGAKLGGAGGDFAGNIFIAAGANLDYQSNATQTLSGIISGDGNLLQRYNGTLTLGDANTYTGTTTIGAITNAGSPTLVVSSFNSVVGGTASSSLGAPTTIANGTIQLGSSNSSPNPTIRYAGVLATGETTDRIINITFNSGANRTLDASGSGLLKFTSPFTSTGLATGVLNLTGTGSGEIAGLPFLFNNLTKSGNGTWTLAGPSGSIGKVAIDAGTLIATDPRALGAAIGNLATTGPTIAAAGTLSLRNNNSVTFGVAGTGYNINNSASGATINVDRVSGTGAATMTVGNLTTTSTAGTWGLNFTGANGASLSAGILDTPVSTVAAVHTITNDVATTNGAALTLASVNNRAATVASPNLVFAGTGTTIVTGAITQTQIDMDLIKNDAGTLQLDGINTYTGTTSVNAGTLTVNGSLADASISITSGAVVNGTGTLTFNVNGVTADQVVNGGTINVAGLTVAVNATGAGLNQTEYVLVDATGGGTITGAFTGVTGAPGYALDYGTPNQVKLVQTGGITFADWRTTNGAGLQTLADDHDGDGVDNGTEYFLFGSGNSTGFTALPGVTNTLGTLSVTWTKAATYAGTYGTDFVVETSATLAAPWMPAVLGASPDQVVISGNNVTYTFPAGTKNFARLKVTGP